MGWKVGLLEPCLRLMVELQQTVLAWNVLFRNSCHSWNCHLFLCCLPLAGQSEECWQGQHTSAGTSWSRSCLILPCWIRLMVCWCYPWKPFNPGAVFYLNKKFSRLVFLPYLYLLETWKMGGRQW